MTKGALCPQCTGLFAATGRHQACSLSCGHIFGRGCITAYLGRHKSCPLCGKSAKKAQIRPLYATAEVKKAAVGPDWKPGVATALELQTRAEQEMVERLERELAELHAEQVHQ